MKQIFNIDGMTCASCQSHVDKAVRKLNGVNSVSVNLLQNNMIVSYDDSICNDSIIIDAVFNAGYKAYINNKEIKESKKDYSLIKLIISAIFLLILMYFSMGNMMWGFKVFKVFDMDYNPMGFSLIQFILVLPIVYIYRGYIISGLKKLFKSPNMESLISIGVISSILYGIYCMFMISLGHTKYHMYLYFESAGMILVFVSLGKYLENVSKKKTTKRLEALKDLSPKQAYLLKGDEEVLVDADILNVGDIVVIKKGMAIPIDGKIVLGNASIDESNITGESIPVYKTIDEEVYSSTIVTSGYIRVKALKVKEDTSISNIIKLVEEASNSKAPISKLVDKISGVFVPIIMAISLITFISNLLYNYFSNPFNENSFELALNFGITVLVIACPCALGLATPVAIMVGTGKAAENGLLIKNAEILENASHIKTVVLDKTGTITCGHPEVTDFISYSNDDLYSILFSFEVMSEHPLAMAIVNYTNKLKNNIYEIRDFNSINGKGITGYINNDFYEIGNIKFLNIISDDIKKELDRLSCESKTPLIIIKNKEIIGIIACKDKVKDTSVDAIRFLKNKNINVVMLTGDNEKTALSIAKEVGIDNVVAEVLPQEKADVIKKLKTNDKNLVAMVGDGVNDAIALMTSDVGITLGGGSDVLKETSDIVLIKNDLVEVANVIDLSKRVLRTIKLGLFWAFFYNFICVFIATGILYYLTDGNFKIEPMYGAIAMSISSVTVVLNALTINFYKVKGDNKMSENKIVLNVSGMMCSHCASNVKNACMKVSGVIDADVNLKKKNVTILYEGDIDIELLKNNIESLGYKVLK